MLYNLNKKMKGTNALSSFYKTTEILEYLEGQDLKYRKTILVCLHVLTERKEYYEKMIVACKLFNQICKEKKKKSSSIQREESAKSGNVYCLSNPSYPNTYKIGYTAKTMVERMQELHSTGVIYPFKLEVAKQVNNCKEAESKLHAILNKYRVVKNREFFKIDLEKIKMLFEMLEGDYYNEDDEEFDEEMDEELEVELDDEDDEDDEEV
jgi:hypothetical protein